MENGDSASQPAGKQAGGQKPGGEQSGGQKPGGQQSGGQKPGGQQSGGQKPGGEPSGDGQPGGQPSDQENSEGSASDPKPNQGAPGKRGGGGAGGRPRSDGPATSGGEEKPQPEGPGQGPAPAPGTGGDTVAPDGQPQSDLVLKKLTDILNDPEAAKKLSKDTGLSREQLEQFTQSFKKPPARPAGPGRQIEVKPGEETIAKPSANLPELGSKMSFTNKNVREKGTMAQDDVRNNIEGVRYQVPAEWRTKVEGYRNKLARSTRRSATAQPKAKTGP
jgi:hypothetical protein